MSKFSGQVVRILAVVLFFGLMIIVSIPLNPVDAAAPEEVALETKIISVSIYSREVQVLRRGEVSLENGLFKLVCDDLPERFVEASLKIEGRGTAEAKIIGIDLQRKKKNEVDEPRFKELSTELNRLTKAYSLLKIRNAALTKRKELTESIGRYESDRAGDELARQVFSTQKWKTILDFLENEKIDTDQRLKEIDGEMTRAYDELKWIHSELKKMQSGGEKGKSVVVDCEITSPGKLTIEISYLVGGAAWSPEYAVRYFKDEGEIELTYNAKIQQATGEDWKDVSVLLSTAKPHAGGAPPVLMPHFLGSARGRVIGKVVQSKTGLPIPYANIVLKGTRMGSMSQADGSFSIAQVPEGVYTVKVMMMGYGTHEKNVKVSAGRDSRLVFRLSEIVVGQTQEIVVEGMSEMIEIRSSDMVKNGDNLYVRGGKIEPTSSVALKGGIVQPPLASHVEAEISRTGFAANLQIRKPVDLETGAEPRRVLVVRKRFPGEYSLYAVPRLSSEVFIRVNTKNVLDIPLLAGPSEAYIEAVPEGGINRVSDFVGREWIKSVAGGEDFVLHLGVDQDIKIDHKLDKKEYLTKPGKKYMKIFYRYIITIENFERGESILELIDRLPVSTRKEIRIEDVKIDPRPDEQSDKGILKWKLTVPPGGKRKVIIEYIVKYPGSFNERLVNLIE